MYQFFSGVPVRTVCDNLKVGVIKHPKEGEIILNSAYEELGNHYCTAILMDYLDLNGIKSSLATWIVVTSAPGKITRLILSVQVKVKGMLEVILVPALLALTGTRTAELR